MIIPFTTQTFPPVQRVVVPATYVTSEGSISWCSNVSIELKFAMD
jgi:hypothetical protein